MKVEERFLNYVKFDTQSDEKSSTTPSTFKQKALGEFLVKELHSLGIQNAQMNEEGEVYAYIEANSDSKDKIGFIAHMDTSPDASGSGIKPRIVYDYDGNDIQLNQSRILSVSEFDNLKRHLHQDLIVTDGTTLLGADDKAGIAIIMSMAERLMTNKCEHGKVSIAFTCDEEVGRGADNFELERFDCDYAYTVDGGDINYIAYENFNAYEVNVEVIGKSVHPGDAKNKMMNASLLAMEFNSLLNPFEVPSCTSGYEGFHHLTDMNGNCEKAVLSYILRNHDADKLSKQIDAFKQACDYMNQKYGYEMIHLKMHEQYKNMKSYIEKDMTCVDRAVRALRFCGLSGESEAIRGGTDGAMLTYKGLSCPNLGTGGENFHGPYEYVSIQDMNTMVDVLMKIVCD